MGTKTGEALHYLVRDGVFGAVARKNPELIEPPRTSSPATWQWHLEQ